MDSAKRNVARAPFPFGIAPPFAPAALSLDLDLDLDLDTVPPSTRTPSSDALCPDRPRDAAAYYDPDASPGTHPHPHPHRALANARQWTGAPMRAVVPLPRRCTPMYASIVLDNDDEVEMGDGAPAPDRMRARTRTGTRAATGGKTPRARRRLARTTARFRDDTRIEEDEDDEEGEWEPGTAGGEGGDGEVSSASRYCSYESITAAEGLAAWSFEVRQPRSRRSFSAGLTSVVSRNSAWNATRNPSLREVPDLPL